MNVLKISFFIFLLFILSACDSSDKPKIADCTKISVVKPQNTKVFHGIVKSQLVTDLSFQSEGKIIFIPYTKGDYVKKGQVLARLDGILYKIKKDEEKAKLKEAQIQYNKSKSYYKRIDLLHKEGAISDNDWEDAYFALKTNNEEIKIQKEKINYLDKEISYNVIIAPYDGFISGKYAQVGAYAKIGEPVLTINGSKETQIEIMVDSNTINKLNLEDKVIAKKDGEIYEGKIKHISPTSINTGGYLVKIYLNNFIDDLKDGMNVDIEIPAHDLYFSYVPLNSIFEENNQKYVFKVVNIKNGIGELKKEKIETGQISDEEIEVVSGLNKDDYIVFGDLNSFCEHKKVKIRN